MRAHFATTMEVKVARSRRPRPRPRFRFQGRQYNLYLIRVNAGRRRRRKEEPSRPILQARRVRPTAPLGPAIDRRRFGDTVLTLPSQRTGQYRHAALLTANGCAIVKGAAAGAR